MKTLLPTLILLLSQLIIMPTVAQHTSISDTELRFRVVAQNATDETVESTSNSVALEIPIKVYCPNAFTPNNDGLNDTFGPIGQGIDQYYIRVFNRWGELLFESANPGDRWDGSYLGQRVPEGNYVFELIASGHQEKRLVKRGSVVLHFSNSI